MYIFECSKSLVDQFKRQAKKAFPSETLAYLLGQVEGNYITVEELWVPDNIDSHCDHDTVYLQPEWPIDAIEYAKDNDMGVVGTIHSHPFTKQELEIYSGTGKHQSEADIDSCGKAWQQISGICVIKECKSGRLTASVRFWGPTVPLDVRIQ